MKLSPGFDPRKLTTALIPAWEAAQEEAGISGTTSLFKEADRKTLVFLPYDGNLEKMAQGIRERLNQHYQVEVDLGAIIVFLVE